ncbi:hypothetical protein [Mycolicibacterium thermoresistibile]
MTRTKTVAAVIGAGAVIVLAAFSAGVPEGVPDGAMTARPGKPTMTTGITVISQTPPATPLTTRAEPQIKGPAPLPSEQEAAK